MRGIGIAAVLLAAVVASAVAACVPIRNMLGDRELVCRDVPDALCARIADLALAEIDLERVEARIGPIPRLQVYPDPAGLPRALQTGSDLLLDPRGDERTRRNRRACPGVAGRHPQHDRELIGDHQLGRMAVTGGRMRDLDAA